MTFDSRLAEEVVDSLVQRWHATCRLRDGFDPDGTSYADTVEELEGVQVALERILGELRAVHPGDPATEYAVRRAVEVLARATPPRRQRVA